MEDPAFSDERPPLRREERIVPGVPGEGEADVAQAQVGELLLADDRRDVRSRIRNVEVDLLVVVAEKPRPRGAELPLDAEREGAALDGEADFLELFPVDVRGRVESPPEEPRVLPDELDPALEIAPPGLEGESAVESP
jgi:hypothetical protein